MRAIIPLDGRPHVSSKIRQYFGDSRGHWEGDTLVVDVTQFPGQHGELSRRRRDRCTWRSASAGSMRNTVRYEVTVEDPATFARPWTARLSLKTDSRLRAGVRVRMPRRELRDDQYSRRGESRGEARAMNIGDRVIGRSNKKHDPAIADHPVHRSIVAFTSTDTWRSLTVSAD